MIDLAKITHVVAYSYGDMTVRILPLPRRLELELSFYEGGRNTLVNPRIPENILLCTSHKDAEKTAQRIAEDLLRVCRRNRQIPDPELIKKAEKGKAKTQPDQLEFRVRKENIYTTGGATYHLPAGEVGWAHDGTVMFIGKIPPEIGQAFEDLAEEHTFHDGIYPADILRQAYPESITLSFLENDEGIEAAAEVAAKVSGRPVIIDAGLEAYVVEENQ